MLDFPIVNFHALVQLVEDNRAEFVIPLNGGVASVGVESFFDSTSLNLDSDVDFIKLLLAFSKTHGEALESCRFQMKSVIDSLHSGVASPDVNGLMALMLQKTIVIYQPGVPPPKIPAVHFFKFSLHDPISAEC